MTPRTLIPLLAVVAACWLAAAPARAGTYEHRSLAPDAPGADGWTPRSVAPRGWVTTARDGALVALFSHRGSFDPGDSAEWSYAAPPGTTVAAWELERTVTGILSGHWNTFLSVVTDGRTRHVAADVPSVNRSPGWVRATGLAGERVVARLLCGGPSACLRAEPAAALRVRDLRVTLHDPYAPAVSHVGGDLAAQPVLAGTARLAFAVADRGAGVHRAWITVDGRTLAPVPVDANGGRCRDLVPGGRFESAHRVPCALSAGATLALDTTRLADGRHTISVLVEDAAGNRVTAYGPVTKTIANRRPAVPAPSTPLVPRPAAPFTPLVPRPAAPPAAAAAIVRARLERRGPVPYGERVRIRGSVTDTAGRPLAGAGVALAERLVDGHGRVLTGARLRGHGWLPRSRWTGVTGVRTRADGRFTAFTRVGPSRHLRLTAPGGAPGPLLGLQVRAPLRVRAGAAGRVRGRVRGPYVPRRGALVALEVRRAGRWVTRRVVRTRRDGRFAATVPGRRVRARAPRQPGLPYAAGAAVSPPRTTGRTAPRTSR